MQTICRVSRAGQIVLPNEVRECLGIVPGMLVQIDVTVVKASVEDDKT